MGALSIALIRTSSRIIGAFMPFNDHRAEDLLNVIRERKKGDRPVDVDDKMVKVVIFSLSNGLYSFYGEEVKEILPCGSIFYVPGAPENILGVINVRGDIESVINIHRILGLADSQRTGKNRIVIAEAEGIRSGILLDSIVDVLDIPVKSISPALSTLSGSLKDFIAGETFYNNCAVSLLHTGPIFRKACT